MILKTEFYNIDSLTLDRYENIVSSGDLSPLLVNEKKIDEKLFKELEKQWDSIQDDIIKITGKNEAYISYLNHKLEYIKHKCKALDGDKWSNTLANIEEIEAKNALSELPKSESIMKTLLRLSKIQGYHLKATETTVKEYFTLIKMHSNDSN